MKKKRLVAYIHAHTKYSYKDAIADIKEYALKIEDLNSKSDKYEIKGMNISEHGNVYSMVSSRVGLEAKGITHLLGVESYVLTDIEKDKANGKRRFHLVMLCKNGCYSKFIEMCSKAGHSKYKSSVKEYQLLDESDLEEYGEYLVCTTACLGGIIPQLILEGRYEDAKEKALEYSAYTDLYLEVQPNDTKDQILVNEALIRMSSETGIPLVMGTDAHYPNKEDYALSQSFKKIAFGGMKQDEDEDVYYSYLRSFEELEEYCVEFDIPMSSLSNTYKIYQKCKDVVFKPEDVLENMPVYPTPAGISVHDYLCRVVYEELNKKILEHGFTDVKERLSRVAHELMVIEKSGFSGYFLILWDWVKSMREQDILIGPGRGCFTGGNKVLMANDTFKEIKDIKIGDFVLNAKGELDRVDNTFVYDVDEPLITISLYSNRSMTCTKDHKLLTNKGYVEARKLTIKDSLIIPKFKRTKHIPSSKEELRGKAFGLYVANSYDDNSYELTIGRDSVGLIEEVKEVYKEVFLDTPKVYDLFRAGKPMQRVSLSSKTKRELKATLRSLSLNHSYDFETGFIKGLFAGTKDIKDIAKNYLLFRHIKLHDYILSVMYKHDMVVTYRKINDGYHYTLNKDSNDLLYKDFYSRYSEAGTGHSKKIHLKDNGYEVRIKSITKKPFKGKVYDLCVKNDHSYNIDTFAVHNSSAGLK